MSAPCFQLIIKKSNFTKAEQSCSVCCVSVGCGLEMRPGGLRKAEQQLMCRAAVMCEKNLDISPEILVNNYNFKKPQPLLAFLTSFSKPYGSRGFNSLQLKLRETKKRPNHRDAVKQ